MPAKVPVLRLLVERGLADDEGEAGALVLAGRVLVDGLPVTSARALVEIGRPLRVRQEGQAWVGRGALKLLGALDALPVSVAGRVAADLGASTGGFTEALLARGAARVLAVDVGRGLLHDRLRRDPRVVCLEGVNVRHLEQLPEAVELVVGDLSFISWSTVAPAVVRLLPVGGQALLLVKPQFEAGRHQVAAGGRVEGEARLAAISRVREVFEGLGLRLLGQVDSSLAGAKAGNVEHFLWMVRADAAAVSSPAAEVQPGGLG